MKAETRRAVARLELILERIAHLPRWRIQDTDGGSYSFNRDDANTVLSLLRKLPEAEECLARGGMVKDWDGNWCHDGDRVRFNLVSSNDYMTGALSYDSDLYKWYVMRDCEGYFYELGDIYEWHKEESND